MIIKLDYDNSFDSFINDRNSKMLGNLYVALDEQRKNSDLNMPAQMKNSLDEAARNNTEPMQDILSVIINKPEFTYDNATIEDVRTLADCVYEQGSPFVFKDDVNEHNYKAMLGYISGKLAIDLAAKHFQHSDGVDTDRYHLPIGIVQANTDEPLVFDSSAYAKKPEKSSFNIFKYIFSSQYRQKYKSEKSGYDASLKSYEEMNARTERTMGLSADYSHKFRHNPLQDGKHLQTKTIEAAKLEAAMRTDAFDGSAEQRGIDEMSGSQRISLNDLLDTTELKVTQKVEAQKSDPSLAKNL